MATFTLGERVDCDLLDVARYLTPRAPQAARHFLAEVRQAWELLAKNPGLGRPRADLGKPGLRSWHLEKFRGYLVFYSETAQGVHIVRVVHGRRDLRTLLADE